MRVAANLALDPLDPTPIYAQLERAIRAAIATGRLRPGDQLPTVRELAVQLRVNANTVARVYAALERDGVFETRRGVGTFVSTTPPKPIPQRERERLLRAFATRVLADAESQGFSLEDVLGALGARRTGGSK